MENKERAEDQLRLQNGLQKSKLVGDSFFQTFSLDEAPPVAAKGDARPQKWPLFIELVPQSSWGDNVRSRLKTSDWDRIRKAEYRRADYKCEICGGTGIEQGCKWPVECHEIWDYNDRTHVQSLVRLIALCPKCHHAKHFGRAELMGDREEVIEHLMTVNQWTRVDAERHVKDAMLTWDRRSRHPWTLELSWLEKNYGIVTPHD